MRYSRLVLLLFLAISLCACTGASDSGGGSGDQDPQDQDPVNQEDIANFYSTYVESPATQARCVLCHVANGLSGHTRLVFISGANQTAANQAVYQSFVDDVENGANILLNKTRGGDSHGGGSIFSSSSDEYADLETFLNMVSGNTGSGQQNVNFYESVSFDSAEQTLRRAAIIFAGRLPTEEEVLAAQASEAGLKQTIRALMQGENFHQFILRGANDRLLTDAFLNESFLEVTDSNSPFYPELTNRRFNAYSAGETEQEEFRQLMQRVRYGVTRAPLELIAYVVENDRPYTEILTADYTMVNPYTNIMYQSGLSFSTESVNEFKVGENNGQILLDEDFEGEFVDNVGTQIFSMGSPIEYPHAGLLNEPVFLNRYPTTDTNRNRARARWTYYHFLDVDIEKSAARTTDPDALADTDNPTLNNPNCTVCHQIMDPVAGAFQNYGDEGWYRDSDGGLDSLPRAYKWEEGSPYQLGDTWFRDMLAPGFGNQTVSSTNTSLQWLSQQIIADERFAEAAVKFWWETVMSDELVEAPENSGDSSYQQNLLTYEVQQEIIQALAEGFRSGFDGGAAYNLKDLLVEMVASNWFRASGVSEALSAEREIELQALGNSRLLTPEELEAKTKSLIGFAWGEADDAAWTLDNTWSNLSDRYRIYYGGIDSLGITERAKVLNSLMSNVALAQALTVACPTVIFDFNRDANDKRLFSEVDRYTTPLSQARQQYLVTGTSTATASQHLLETNLQAGEQRLRISFANPYWDSQAQQSSLLVIHDVNVTDSQANTVLSFNAETVESISGALVYQNDQNQNTGSRYWDDTQNTFTGFLLWQGYIDVPLVIDSNDNYQISITASRLNLPDRDVNLGVVVNGTDPDSGTAGEQAIRTQLQLLHQMMLGESIATDSEELDASYELFVELWQQRQTNNYPASAIAWDSENCDMQIDGWWDEDRGEDLADPEFIQGTWVSMLIYFLTDYMYLHE